VTSSDLDPARLPRRVNTVVAGILELLPGPPVRGAGRRVPVEEAATGTCRSGAFTASAVSSAAATALAGRRCR
jgi:hypothetical protein